MTTSRLRLGQLLVDARLITPEALTDVLAAQQKDGRRLGTLLVERGHISEVQLTQILSHQLSVPWVSLLKIEFSRQLLNLVPREVAERYGVLPIYVRRVRGQGDTLYIATADPTNEEALRACGTHAGLPVRPMIAPPSDVRSAIRAYYGVPSSEADRPAADTASAPPAATEPAPAATNPPAVEPRGSRPCPHRAPQLDLAVRRVRRGHRRSGPPGLRSEPGRPRRPAHRARALEAASDAHGARGGRSGHRADGRAAVVDSPGQGVTAGAHPVAARQDAAHGLAHPPGRHDPHAPGPTQAARR